jgi:hypothetical protein
MKQKYYLIYFIFLFTIVLINGCIQQAKENPTIGEIISNPTLYDGKTVTVEGKYGSWVCMNSCSNNPVTVSKSDFLIYNGADCLYAHPQVEILYAEGELDPVNEESCGLNIKIKAKVTLVEGKPYLASI